MSNMGGVPPDHPPKRNRFSSSAGYLAERLACRAPVSRSKAAPYGRAMQRWPILEECAAAFAALSLVLRFGGAYRDRTDDLMLAKQPLSQLS